MGIVLFLRLPDSFMSVLIQNPREVYLTHSPRLLPTQSLRRQHPTNSFGSLYSTTQGPYSVHFFLTDHVLTLKKVLWSFYLKDLSSSGTEQLIRKRLSRYTRFLALENLPLETVNLKSTEYRSIGPAPRLSQKKSSL